MAKKHVVDMAAFERQLAENVIGADSLREIKINAEETITVKIPIDTNDATNSAIDDMADEMKAAGDDQDKAALVVLQGNPDVSAEEQLEKWKATGRSSGLLITTWAILSREARENLAEFRYRR